MRPPLPMVRVLLTLGFLATATSGCAFLGTAFGRPASMLEQAQEALAKKDQETAYRLLKQIATKYPESRESDQAFPLAASSLKSLYHLHRYRDPDSVWVTSEPLFMFQWVARYYDGGFPVEPANILLRGMPYNVFQHFEVYARSHPDLSQWALRAEDDNGIIQSVTAERTSAGQRGVDGPS